MGKIFCYVKSSNETITGLYREADSYGGRHAFLKYEEPMVEMRKQVWLVFMDLSLFDKTRRGPCWRLEKSKEYPSYFGEGSRFVFQAHLA